MKKVILEMLAMLGITVAVLAIHSIWQDVQVTSKAESKCISKLISQGVERKDIKVFDGKCYLRK